MVRISILEVGDYYRHRFCRGGWDYVKSITSSGYPRVLSLGYYSRSEGIVVCKLGNWELRLKHEIGHSIGLKHTNKMGYVMNPYGFMRGNKYE